MSRKKTKRENKKQANLWDCNSALSLPQVKKRLNVKQAGSPSRFDNSDLLFDNLITVEELAVIFRVSPQTVRNWVALGKIPYIQIGRRNLFQRSSLQQWLNQKEKPLWQ